MFLETSLEVKSGTLCNLISNWVKREKEKKKMRSFYYLVCDNSILYRESYEQAAN